MRLRTVDGRSSGLHLSRTALAGAFLGLTLARPAGADYETPAVLSAPEILPPALLESAHHRVADAVANDGYMNSYRIESSYGVFEVQGTGMLRERVREIEALAALESTARTKVVLTGLVRPARDIAGTFGAMATSPVDTARGLPGGVRRRFDRYASQARSVAGGAGDVAEAVRETSTAEIPDKARGRASSVFEVDAAARRWHRKLGTDPYTTNPVLREAVARVAKLDASAGFSFDQLPIPIPEPDVTDYLEDAGDLVWSQSRRKLNELNEARLTEVGTPPEAISAFLDHPWFSPTLQTLVVSMLRSLEGVEGRGALVGRLLDADSEAVARFLTESVALLAGHHANRAPLARLVPDTPAATAVAIDGRVLGFAAVDHLIWSEAAEGVATRLLLHEPGAQHELWLTGSLSDRCRWGLRALEVEPREEVPLDALSARPIAAASTTDSVK